MDSREISVKLELRDRGGLTEEQWAELHSDMTNFMMQASRLSGKWVGHLWVVASL